MFYIRVMTLTQVEHQYGGKTASLSTLPAMVYAACFSDMSVLIVRVLAFNWPY